MGNRKTTIEFNGRKYNALTGEMLRQPDSTPAVVHPTIRSSAPATNPVHQSGRVIDGFNRGPLATVPYQQAQPTTSHASNPKAKTVHRHAPVGHIVRRAPERSKTLMRTTVAKPSSAASPAIRSKTASLSSSHQAASHSSQHAPRYSVSQERIKRAQTTGKSGLISKFGSSTPEVTKKTAPLAVRPAPAHASHATPPATRVSAPPSTHRVTSQSTAVFNRALQSATAHEQLSPKRVKAHGRAARKLGISNKVMTTATSALAVLLLAGFFAYQNMPNISLRMAASRAGFSASMPGYRPSGFAMQGPIKYGPGEITISFKSNSDNRAYQVTQRPSKWNSETLLDSFVAADKKPYQTFQKQGKTIYIYNDSDATWVNGGIWYQVAGNSSLTSDQLLNIASSL